VTLFILGRNPPEEVFPTVLAKLSQLTNKRFLKELVVREMPSRRAAPVPPVGAPVADLSSAPAAAEPGLRDYWQTLRKRRRLVLLVVAAAVGLGVLLTVLTTPLYTAQVTLKIERNQSIAGFGDLPGGGLDYVQTQMALLKSRALAARVIQDLHLGAHPQFVAVSTPLAWLRQQVVGPVVSAVRALSRRAAEPPDAAPGPDTAPAAPPDAPRVPPRLVNLYLKLLEVKAVPGTSLVTVLVTTPSPRLSHAIAAAHGAHFIRLTLETRFELTQEARSFLEKKLAEVKAKLERSEAALQRFRQRHGVVALEGNQNVIVDRMVALNRQLTEARTKRIELESLTRSVKEKNFEYLSTIIGNTLIGQLKGRLEELEAEQARQATIYKPDHPRLLDLKQQLTEARRRLRLEIDNVVRGITADYAAIQAQEQALQAEAERQQRAALNLKELGVEYSLLQGELDAHRAIYDSVAKRMNETSVSTDSPLSNIQITDPAERPQGPASPQILANLLLAVGLGLFGGVGLAFLRDHFDATVHTPDDIWRTVGVPTLGVVPHLNALARREYALGHLDNDFPLRRLVQRWATNGQSVSEALTVTHHPLSLLAESYRTIRTVLLLGHAPHPPQVILLTSAHPGEGKTTITLNLAITLAQSGRSVVVVDADLRQGNCHAQLGMHSRPGLADLLTEDLPLDEVVQSADVPGLFLLATGAIPHNPTDLLASDRMQETLESLRQRFDFVLIDSPPAIAISDAAVMSVMCDGVVLIVRNETTSTDAVRHTVEHLEAVGAHVLGAVLNCIDIRHPDYAAYRRYYSSYYSAVQQETKG
jgi:capsular exopolysaccharide synthesis family protein